MKNIAGLRPDQRAFLRRYVLTYPRVESDLTVMAQKRLDKFAQEKGYDNILSACSYSMSSVPRFALDAAHCIELRDKTWAKVYSILQDLKGEKRPLIPAVNLLAELPPLTWEEELPDEL